MDAPDPAAGLRIHPCGEDDARALTAREPAGKDYASSVFAAQQQGLCLFLVAWIDDVPVGSGELVWKQVPELRNLHVEAGFRSRGVGSGLVAAAEDAARPQGRIGLAVGVDNPDARRLYERLGFAATGASETCTYEYVDDGGVRRRATETSQRLEKALPRAL
ncbi:GNAT family N-acetyltransferase [Brachybacterium halotolerans subsp. kimchii]|uniref:GNAT family N-acetyltransferase n=1 Tax=Brachybacterium halotolerans TaxID=2795215 RepID=UPI001E3DB4E3|nr:GNAT family N-acetyltransferase [Brachybacterium halotolerans]UEJ83877.1 GNAT family N-acetyltransferase [Brachybacterium halotolerans subsp. kimchii]